MSRFLMKDPHRRVPKLPQWFRAHAWQPIKALLSVAFLGLLTPTSLNAPAGLASTYAIPYGLWSGIMAWGVQLILFYILCHTMDSVDDITYVDYCKTPTPLLRRYTWWVSLAITTVGGALSLSLGLASLVSYTPLRGFFLAVPLRYLLGGLEAAGIRLLQIRRLDRRWADERTVEEGTQWPGLAYRIGQILLLPLGLWLGVYYLLGKGWLFIALNTVYLVAWMVVQPELRWLRILLLCGVAVIFFLRYGKSWRARRRLLRSLEELSRAGLISYRLVGRPYGSLFSRRVLFGFYAMDVEGTRWISGVASCGFKRAHIIACDNRILQFRHQLKFRVAPQQTAVGVVTHSGEELGVWYTTYPVKFPENAFPEDLPAPAKLRAAKKTLGGKPVPPTTHAAMIIAPVPTQLSLRLRAGFAPLDNGSEVYGYQTWSPGAFCRFIERKYTGDT